MVSMSASELTYEVCVFMTARIFTLMCFNEICCVSHKNCDPWLQLASRFLSCITATRFKNSNVTVITKSISSFHLVKERRGGGGAFNIDENENKLKPTFMRPSSKLRLIFCGVFYMLTDRIFTLMCFNESCCVSHKNFLPGRS